MRRAMSTTAVLAALTLVSAACGDGQDDSQQAEDAARRTATSAVQGAEALTRLNASLTGTAEVPGPGDPDGAGTAVVNLDVSKGQVCYEVSVQKLDRPSAMHIHDGATGKSGDPVVTLTTPTATDTTTTGCVDADRTLMGRIAATPGNFYVNVHSATYPQGAVRGQLSQ